MLVDPTTGGNQNNSYGIPSVLINQLFRINLPFQRKIPDTTMSMDLLLSPTISTIYILRRYCPPTSYSAELI